MSYNVKLVIDQVINVPVATKEEYEALGARFVSDQADDACEKLSSLLGMTIKKATIDSAPNDDPMCDVTLPVKLQLDTERFIARLHAGLSKFTSEYDVVEATPTAVQQHDQNNNEQPKPFAPVLAASTNQAEQNQNATNQETLPPKQPHVVLKYSQADVDSGRFPSQWLPNLESAFQRIGTAKNKPVSVSYVEISEFEKHVQLIADNKEKELKCVWTLFPTGSSGKDEENIPSDEVKKLLPNVYFRRMELGSLCSNKSEDLSEDLDVVVFNDDFSVDDMREVKSYSASKAWDSIFSRIPEIKEQVGRFDWIRTRIASMSSSVKNIVSTSLPSKVTVRLIVDPLVIEQGMIRDSWLRSVCNTFTHFATERKLSLNVELIKQNHNTYFDTEDDPNFRKVSSGVMNFYVISAKLDREPFPPNRHHLELGYMVSERGDCDSIAIDDRNDEVNRDCNSRQYNSNRAWNKIMDKVAVKKISSWF